MSDRLDALTHERAVQFAALARANIAREYPNKPDHVLTADADLVAPRDQHPAFHGSYDWHSSVHMRYGADRDAPGAWEPSGADFLSPVLMEAELLRRVLPPPAFAAWLDGFLPGLAQRTPAALFAPAQVSDRTDPQIVHLDGLNLSRAWCLAGIAAALPAGDPRIAVLRATAGAHRAAGLEGLDSGDYLGAHWLASFALLALGG